MPADHSIRHRSYVDGCYLCKLRSVAVSSAATPSRSSAMQVQSTNDLAKRWDKDIPAYRRLVKDGLQPEGVDGCAEIEKRADHKEQVQGETFEPISAAS